MSDRFIDKDQIFKADFTNIAAWLFSLVSMIFGLKSVEPYDNCQS